MSSKPVANEADVTPIGRVRKIIATRMHASLQASAQLTSVVEADVSGIMAARRRWGAAFRQRHGVSLSPFTIVAHQAARVLTDHPKLNSVIDVSAGTVTHFSRVNLGIAIDTLDGLLVANVKAAEHLSVSELGAAIADIAERARSRRLKPIDLEGGTFTVTNTGSRGSLLDTPILNSPEVGILAVGRVTRRPVVRTEGGREVIVPADVAFLCLTYDHQLVDGADAARFLEDLRVRLENQHVASAEALDVSEAVIENG